MPDGKVVIDTTLNNDGVEKGVGGIGKAFDRLIPTLKNVSNELNNSFGPKQQKQIDSLTEKLARQQDAAQKAARDAAELRRQYEAMQSMESTPGSMRKMETELSRVQREIQKTEKEYAKLEVALRKIQDVADFEKIATGAISPQNATEIARLTGELETSGQKLLDMDERAQSLQVSIEKIKLDPDSSNEAQKLASKLQSAEEKAARLAVEAGNTAGKLEELKSAPGQASEAMDKFAKSAQKVNKEVQKTTKQMGGLGGMVDKLTSRIGRLVVAAFVFNIIRRALRSLISYLGAAMKTNNEFVSSMAQIKGNLLTAFQPIYEAVMPALNAFMAALARVTAYIAAFINLLFGKGIKASQDSAKALYGQAKALSAVGKAAKGAVAPFDELMVLSQQEAGGGATEIAPDFSADFTMLDKLNGKLAEIWEKARGLLDGIGVTDFIERIRQAISSIEFDAIREKAASVFKGIMEWADLLSPHVQKAMQSMFGYLATIGESTIKSFEIITKALLGGAALFFEQAKGTVLKAIQGIFDNASEIFNNFEGIFIGLFDPLIEEIEMRMPEIEQGIANMIEIITLPFVALYDIITRVIRDITGELVRFIADSKEELNTHFGSIIDTAVRILQKLRDFFVWAWQSISVFYEAHIRPLMYNLGGLIGETVLVIIKWFDEMLQAIETILGGVIDFITGVFTGDWERAWRGVLNIIIGIFNGIVSTVEGAINLIVSAINFLIDAINSISIDIPKTPFTDAFTLGFDIKPLNRIDLSSFKIPALATGAVIPPNQEFLALLGDQKRGRNIEAPEGLIRDIIREELANLELQASPIYLSANPDMAALIRILFPGLEQENRRRGTSFILGATT